jgi:hypothetical protein
MHINYIDSVIILKDEFSTAIHKKLIGTPIKMNFYHLINITLCGVSTRNNLE